MNQPHAGPVARILGTGRAAPDRVVTNDDLSRTVETNDTWITERTGIKQRRLVAPGQASSDLAADAGRRAIERAGLSPDDIDAVICATVTPDMPLPSCAVLVQRKVGITRNIPSFDLSAACGGFLYGLAVAEGLIRGGQIRRILLCGVEVLSRCVDWSDRNTCILFGDGAGAVVLGPAEPGGSAGLISTHLFADGSLADALCIPAGGSLRGATAETVAAGQHLVKMNGRAIFNHAVRNLSSSCQVALEHNGLSTSDVDLVVPHQANLRILEAVAQRLGMPMSKFYINIDRYGNTSSASVPIALDEAVAEGRVQPGQLLLMCALGGGLAWGSALVRW